MAKRQSISERFWSKVGPPDENGCRPWLAFRDRDGYGRFSPPQQGPVPAHAFAWRLTYHGPTKPGAEEFRHSCDRPWCAEPSHAYPGTHQENENDKTARGRRPIGDAHPSRTRPETRPRGDLHYSRTHPERLARGERVNTARLTEGLVREVWAALDRGETQDSIAGRMGVGRTSISAIKTGRNWAWLMRRPS